jgi:hypothetical protein
MEMSMSTHESQESGSPALRIQAHGKGAAGGDATFPHRTLALLLDAAFPALPIAGFALLATHPLSPLGSLSRKLLVQLPETLAGTLPLAGAASAALLGLLLPRLNRRIPSPGNLALGIQNGRYLAGGGLPGRAVACGLGFAAFALATGALIQGRPFDIPITRALTHAEDMTVGGDLNWSELPFFRLAGRWPVRLAASATSTEEVARITLGYAPGIVPHRYLPSVTFQWENSGTELRIEGPRTHPASRAFVERFADDLVDLRSCNSDCLGQLAFELKGLETRLGGARLEKASMTPWESPKLKGLRMELETEDLRILRILPLLPSGAIQPITWIERKRSLATGTGDAIIARLLGNLGAQEETGLLRTFVDARIERVNLQDLLGTRGGMNTLEKALKTDIDKKELRERRDILQGIQHLLISKLTLEPSRPDTYLHLGGTSYLLWKHAVALGDSGTTAAARRTLLTVRKYLEDFGPSSTAELKQINDILGKMSQ